VNDLRDLYQDMIFDHYRQPRNYGQLENANHKAEGYNPLCGDKVSLTLTLKDGVIHDLKFEGSGCAISTASASLMTEALKGKTAEEALSMLEDFKALVTGASVAKDMESSLYSLACKRFRNGLNAPHWHGTHCRRR